MYDNGLLDRTVTFIVSCRIWGGGGKGGRESPTHESPLYLSNWLSNGGNAVCVLDSKNRIQTHTHSSISLSPGEKRPVGGFP